MRLSFDLGELRRQRMSDAHLDQVLDAMHRDGFVVLEQVVDHGPLDMLKERMDRDSRELLAFCETIGGNPRDVGHLQQGPPPFAPHVFRQLLVHPLVTQVSHALLGEYAFNNFYNGNTNAPGSVYQQVHLDNPHMPRGGNIPHPAYSFVVNIVPQDADESNGAVELWPGTHRMLTTTPVPEDVVERRRAEAPPIQSCVRKGDILLRDARLWHRGIPNSSNEFRHMIALVHVAGWLPRRTPLRFGVGCEEVFADSRFDSNAHFTGEPIDYLLGPTKRVFQRRQLTEEASSSVRPQS
ncbi:MAG: phytanoyl-CoA dioxygenase family protein [Pseudomonadales bacterium]